MEKFRYNLLLSVCLLVGLTALPLPVGAGEVVDLYGAALTTEASGSQPVLLLAARPRASLHQDNDNAEDDSNDTSDADTLRAWRREHRIMPFALVPGWVQFRRHQVPKGIILMGGFVACVAGAYYFNSAGDADYATWEITQSDSLKSQVQQEDTLYAALACAAVGIYAFNFLDAFVLGRPTDKAPTGSLTNPYLPQVGMALLPHRSPALTLEWQL